MGRDVDGADNDDLRRGRHDLAEDIDSLTLTVECPSHRLPAGDRLFGEQGDSLIQSRGPEIARGLGEGIRGFRTSLKEPEGNSSEATRSEETADKPNG